VKYVDENGASRLIHDIQVDYVSEYSVEEEHGCEHAEVEGQKYVQVDVEIGPVEGLVFGVVFYFD